MRDLLQGKKNLITFAVFIILLVLTSKDVLAECRLSSSFKMGAQFFNPDYLARSSFIVITPPKKELLPKPVQTIELLFLYHPYESNNPASFNMPFYERFGNFASSGQNYSDRQDILGLSELYSDAERYPVLTYFVAPARIIRGVTPISPNTWYHAAVVIFPDKVRLYLNGALEKEVENTFWSGDADRSFLTIGEGFSPASPFSSDFNGFIDEFRISNSDRSNTSNFGQFIELFVPDNDTTVLFHFDGDISDDSTSKVTGRFVNIRFDDVGSIAASCPPTKLTLTSLRPFYTESDRLNRRPAIFKISVKKNNRPVANSSVFIHIKKPRGNPVNMVALTNKRGTAEVKYYFNVLDPYGLYHGEAHPADEPENKTTISFDYRLR